MKCNFKLLCGVLSVALAISVVANVYLQKPLYTVDVYVPVSPDGGTQKIVHQLDSTWDKDDYLLLMNRLSGYSATPYAGTWTEEIPDFTIWHNVPSMGVVDGIYSVVLEGDAGYLVVNERPHLLTPSETQEILTLLEAQDWL